MTQPTLDEIIEGLEEMVDGLTSAKEGAMAVLDGSLRTVCAPIERRLITAQAALTRLKALKPRPIEEAPELERVFVCGYQKPHGTTRGYWWYHEDAVVDGVAIERPHATHYFKLMKPDFPDSDSLSAIKE